jgi:thiol:disulfide interchange protein DsbD
MFDKLLHKFFVFAFASLALCALTGNVHADEDYLQPEQAFRFSARMADATTIEVSYQIADGYYLYRERFSFSADGAQLGAPAIPPGKVKFDATFNKEVETYRHQVTIRIPVQANAAFNFKAISQGCADRGLCYSPMESVARLFVAGSSVQGAAPAQSVASPAAAADSEMGRIEASLASGRLLLILPLFFLLGLGLSFTPCVLPMVPILSFIIVGEGAQTSRQRGFVLSLAYSLGMAIVYTALGVSAGLIGEGLSAALQSPPVLAGFAMLMVVLSLSMFGLYQLQVPASLQLLLTRLSEQQRGGKLAGVFIMGAISALIVGPCVAAPLAGALVYISQTRDVVIGGSALFAMAVGMSVPLLLVGLSAGTLLPRAGSWMDAVKPFFGVLMLALALWMVVSLIPAWVLMLGWGLLGLGYGGFLLASKKWGVPAKTLGVLFALLGLVQLAGVASGGRDAWAPLAHLTGTQSAKTAFTRVKTNADVDAAIRGAHGRPVMLDFYADWCVSCLEMEKRTFTDKAVAGALDNMLLLQADVTANDAEDKALLKRFGLFGPPGIIIFDKDGQEVRAARVIGYQAPERFLQSLKQVLP